MARSLSLDPRCIWVWSAMETCSAQLEAVASWASHPFFHSLLSGPATSLSAPPQRLHAPASHNQSLSHGLNHAKLMGTLSPARGWKQRFVTRLLFRQTPRTHVHAVTSTHTKTDRHTCARCDERSTVSPCQMLCFISGLTSWFGPNSWRKQCVIEFISQWLDYSDDGSA